MNWCPGCQKLTHNHGTAMKDGVVAVHCNECDMVLMRTSVDTRIVQLVNELKEMIDLKGDDSPS